MAKVVGVQSELNEIAEALTVNGFEVTNMLNTSRKLDAIVYFNDESEMINANRLTTMNAATGDKKIVKINAAKTNISKIIEILKSI